MTETVGSMGVGTLEHEAFLRRVALALVPAHEVDDLLQETWLAATVGLSGARSPRAWLRRVVHNLAVRRHRRVARQTARERAAALAPEVASTAEILERLEAHRELAAAVAALDEPYRGTILLRFFEELPPREIARRHGVPASTVRTRIERGLVRLRGHLEGRDLRAFATLVLLPRGGERLAAAGVSTATVTWGLLMTFWHHKAALGAAVLLLAAAAAFTASFWHAPPEPPAREEPAGMTAAGAARPAETGPREPPGATPQREAAPPREAAEEPGLRCRFIEPDGSPLAGIPVLLERVAPAAVTVLSVPGLEAPTDPEPAGTTDEHGVVSLAGVSPGGRLWAGEGFVTLATDTPGEGSRSEREGLVVAVRAVRLQGQVVDADGAPLAGVAVTAVTTVLDRCEQPLDRAAQIAPPRLATADDGRFSITAPAVADLVLQFQKPGFREVREAGTLASFRYVVMRPLAPPEYRLAGRVVDAAGRGVWGATVVIDGQRVESGLLGGFELKARSISANTVILAAKRGHRPARRDDLVERLRREHEVDGIEIVLGGAPLELRGVVVPAAGESAEGLVVAIWEPASIHMFTTAEDLARGAEGELALVPGIGSARVDARTDAAGRFTVTGLGAQPYRLRIFDPSTLVSVTTEPVEPGGGELRVELPARARRSVAGVVRDRQGRPIEGVKVVVGLVTWRTSTLTMVAAGAATTTGADGRFELASVPVGDAHLSVGGPAVVEQRWPLADLPAGEDADLRVWRQCRFRLELATPTPADRVQVLDAEGRALELRQTRGGIVRSGEGWDVTQGTTPVLEVSEQAATVVLLANEKEVLRIVVALDADETVTVR